MSISNLVKNTSELRLLDNPWSSKEVQFSQATLKKAKNLLDTWERKYHNRMVRHESPHHVPKIVTFEKVDEDLIVPLLTLGGN